MTSRDAIEPSRTIAPPSSIVASAVLAAEEMRADIDRHHTIPVLRAGPADCKARRRCRRFMTSPSRPPRALTAPSNIAAEACSSAASATITSALAPSDADHLGGLLRALLVQVGDRDRGALPAEEDDIARPLPIGGSSRPCSSCPPPTTRIRRPSSRPRPGASPLASPAGTSADLSALTAGDLTRSSLSPVRCRRPLMVALLSAVVAIAGATPAAAADHGITLLSSQRLDSRLVDLTLSTPALRQADARQGPAARGLPQQKPRRYPSSTSCTAPLTTTGPGPTRERSRTSRAGRNADRGDAGRRPGRLVHELGQPRAGGPPEWETFHIQQLIPWIDDRYRVDPSRAARAIAGLSMGGFGAMSYAARHPDLFSWAGSFSGAVDIVNYPLVAVIINGRGAVDGGRRGRPVRRPDPGRDQLARPQPVGPRRQPPGNDPGDRHRQRPARPARPARQALRPDRGRRRRR